MAGVVDQRTESNDAQRSELRDAIHDGISQLPSREREVMLADQEAGGKANNGDLADKFGNSISAISKARRRAHGKLHSILASYDPFI